MTPAQVAETIASLWVIACVVIVFSAMVAARFVPAQRRSPAATTTIRDLMDDKSDYAVMMSKRFRSRVRPEWDLTIQPPLNNKGAWIQLVAHKPYPARGMEEMTGSTLFEYVLLLNARKTIEKAYFDAVDRLAQKCALVDTVDAALLVAQCAAR